MTATYDLVVTDVDRISDTDPTPVDVDKALVAAGATIHAVTVDSADRFPTYRYTLSGLRNTHAHGIACRLGFVAVIRHTRAA